MKCLGQTKQMGSVSKKHQRYMVFQGYHSIKLTRRLISMDYQGCCLGKGVLAVPKLTEEVMEFVSELTNQTPDIRSTEIKEEINAYYCEIGH